MAGRRAAGRLFGLDGVFLPLTTPFTETGGISGPAIRANLAKYERIPFKGYVVAGSNGEAPYLNPDERVAVVKAVAENTERIVIGGATAESTEATCELAENLRGAGADGLLVMPPFYFRKRMTEEALGLHFRRVAERSGLPVVIYNMPYVTGIDIGTPTIAKLAQHPLIRGVKDSDIRKCAGTVQATRGSCFDVLIGSAGYLLGALLAGLVRWRWKEYFDLSNLNALIYTRGGSGGNDVNVSQEHNILNSKVGKTLWKIPELDSEKDLRRGCSGGINGLAGIMGEDICEIHRLYRAGRILEANQIQNKIAKPDILFMSELGVAGLKRGMDLVGLDGGDCRLPILPVSEQEEERIRQCLQEVGFLTDIPETPLQKKIN